MAYTTDLVYAIYGKDKTASKALKGVGKESKTLGEQFKHMGKVAAASFAVVGAAAGKFAFDAAKAASEDEKSQKLLANSIKNSAHATDAQVKATESFITKMQLTYGVADDKLRPAFAKLTRATGDLGESQKLMGLAMDISAGTGKDLESVSFALAKAHEGNMGALTRLGIPLDKNIVKTKDFNGAVAVLSQQFQGSAKTASETFAGKMAIVTQHINESKEQIGYALMPVLQSMAAYLTDTVVPNVQSFVDGLTGVKNSSGEAYDSIHALGEKTRGFFKFLGDNKGLLAGVATLIGSIFIGVKVYGAVSAMVGALALLRGAFATTTAVAATTAAAEAAATGGASLLVALPAIAAIATAFGIPALIGLYSGGNGGQRGKGKVAISNRLQSAPTGTFEGGMKRAAQHRGRAVGGSLARGVSYMVGEHGPEMFTPSTSGVLTRNENLGRVGGGVTVVVNVHGSVVQEKDLAVAVRDNIAQLMRRKGLNPAILGV